MKTTLESDVSTLDGILHASYEVLSGPAGQPRDWERYRTLFIPGARLMPVVTVAGAKPYVRLLTLEDYIRRVEPIFAVEDFWERETSRQAEITGRVAHVLSMYESLRDPNGSPFERGANSMQLFYDGTRPPQPANTGLPPQQAKVAPVGDPGPSGDPGRPPQQTKTGFAGDPGRWWIVSVMWNTSRSG